MVATTGSFFRGVGFTNQEAENEDYAVWSQLYNLAPAEQGLSPNSMLNTVFNRILDANPGFTERPEERTPEFWQKFRLDCQWDGVPLNQWSLWDLFSVMGYSNEAITMLYRVLGFNGTFLSQMNAGVAYQLLEDFPSEPNFKTLKDGFSTLPNALAANVGKENIFLNTTVEGIDNLENGQYALRYSTVPEGGKPAEGTIQAGQIILCLPRLALEKLFIGSNAFNTLEKTRSEQLWNTLQSTTSQPLLKINLYYNKAWWGNGITGRPSVAYGPNFSDLPLGSVYPFYALDEESVALLEYQESIKATGLPTHLDQKALANIERIKQKKYELPAALTIYCDYLNINYWLALQDNGPKFTSEMQQQYNDKKPQTLFAASQAIVDRATAFFKQLFDTHYVPTPVLTSCRIWAGQTTFTEASSKQFGYGVHQWALQADDKQVMQDLIEPLPNLYTCGEAYSDYQGWVEGALRSANLVLGKAFGMKPLHETYPDAANQAQQEYNTWAQKLIKQYILSEESLTQVDEGVSKKLIEALGLYETQLGFGVKLEYFDKKNKDANNKSSLIQ